MSIMNAITNTGMVLGIPIALLATGFLLHNIIRRKNILYPAIAVIISCLIFVPYILCEYHGAEYVESEDILIYPNSAGEYLLTDYDNSQYVYVCYEEGYYTQERVNAKQINKIKDNSEPRIQIVTTKKRFGPFETSKQVHILWLPTIK